MARHRSCRVVSFAFRDVSFGTVKPWKSQQKNLILDLGSVYSPVKNRPGKRLH